MKFIEKIKDRFKVDEEVKNCPLNYFIQDYYDTMKPEYYDEAIKDTKNTIRDNKIYIRFLKVKIKENKSCTDWYNTSRFEDLLKREILEKEYINNTGQHILEYLKYKKRKYNELKRQQTMKKGDTNGEESSTSN